MSLRLWVKTNGLTLTSRQLRLAKATWLLRRYSGDSFRTAQSLGNKPQAVHDHYGGKGNLEQAIADWSGLWASSHAQGALAPGKCQSPGRHEPTTDRAQHAGQCSEAACLSCRHYRGENSLDYVHSILSYRHYLCFRAGSNPDVAPLIDIIERILDAYLERNADQRETVLRLRAQIGDRPHRRFAALIRLVEIMHAA